MTRVPGRIAHLLLPPFDVLNRKAAALRAAGHDVISLGQAVPGFGPPRAAIDAARAALDDAQTHRYSADAGLVTLREALCEKLAAHRRIAVQPDDVIVTAGGNQAFMLAAMTLIDPGDEVVLTTPYFVNHEMAIRAIGGVALEAPLSEADGFSPRWSSLEPHVTSRTRAVVLCSPSNPTGAVIEKNELTRIVRELSSRGVIVFSDETYMHFADRPPEGGSQRMAVDPPSAAAIDGWRDNVVIVGTFSKSFGMTGWRTGYMLADRPLCEQALKVQDAMIICAPTISQIAAEAAIRDDWNYAHAFRGELIARRAALQEGIGEIPQLHWTPTSGGFFAFVRVAGCEDSMALASEILDRAHVIAIPGATFGRAGEGFLRLSYGAATIEQLREAFRRLRGFFDAPQQH
jgi:aspartate/methionine/tyrosine aminotransferase